VYFRSHVLIFFLVITQQHKTQHKNTVSLDSTRALVGLGDKQTKPPAACGCSRLWNMKLSVLAEIY